MHKPCPSRLARIADFVVVALALALAPFAGAMLAAIFAF